MRYRFLEGLYDEREPAYAHYFFFNEVSHNYDSAVYSYQSVISFAS